MILSDHKAQPAPWRLTMRQALFTVAAAAAMVFGAESAVAQVSSNTQALTLGTSNLSVEQGKDVTMNLRWQAARLASNYTVFVHFVAANGTQYPGGDHAPSVSTSTWSGLVSYNRTRTIPTTMPTGDYTVRVGLYSGNTRVTLVPGAGVTQDDQQRYIVGRLNVRAPGAPAPGTTTQTTINMLGTANLTATAGQTVTMPMRWNAVPMDKNYQVFVHFVAANGSQFPGGDHAPSVPTTTWNGAVGYNATRTLPTTMPNGTYSIRVGLYENVAPYTNRVTLNPGSGVTADAEKRYTVGTLTVGSTAPAPAPASCSFNGQTVASGSSVTAYQASSVPSGSTCVSQTRTCTNGTLSGAYTFPSCTVQAAPARTVINMLGTPNLTTAAGQTVTMAMRWNAIPAPENYQVFVHFVAANGNQYPGGDHAPSVATSTWSGNISYNATRTLPAEMPAGTYSIRAGLYRNVAPYTDRIQLDPGMGVTADAERRYTIGTLTVTAPTVPAPSPSPAPGVQLGPVGQDPNAYAMTMSDEFSNGFNSALWNDHVWYESSNPTRNFAVKDGMLKIWPQRDASGRFFNRTIDTDGKFEQTYGYFEMRARLNRGRGVWPAFWLYAHPGNDRPEIDIMEAYPGGGPNSGWGDSNLHPTNFGMTLHKANGDYSYHEVPYATTMAEFIPRFDLSAGFNVYAARWDSTGVTFYFNGKQIGPKYNDSSRYYNRPMYVMLDLWFGSASGTPDNTTPTGEGNSYEVDYVRVWRIR